MLRIGKVPYGPMGRKEAIVYFSTLVPFLAGVITWGCYMVNSQGKHLQEQLRNNESVLNVMSHGCNPQIADAVRDVIWPMYQGNWDSSGGYVYRRWEKDPDAVSRDLNATRKWASGLTDKCVRDSYYLCIDFYLGSLAEEREKREHSIQLPRPPKTAQEKR